LSKPERRLFPRALIEGLGHGQSAEIFKPKTRYLQEIFHSLSKEVEFEFDFLSGFWPAYPDTDKFCHQRVWGYGEPEHDEIKGLQGSIKYILDTLKEKGPFSGMVGFSSGAAMTAIVTSLLEKRENFDGSPLMVQYSSNLSHPSLSLRTNCNSLDEPPGTKICYMPQWIQVGKHVLRSFLLAEDRDPDFSHDWPFRCYYFYGSDKEACTAV
jgi:hypothetical protein